MSRSTEAVAASSASSQVPANPVARRREIFAITRESGGDGRDGREMLGLGGGELTPPYTPRRYLEAIEEFLTYGVYILVVDSFSHCWEGPGGVLEMADHAEEHGRKGLMKWLMPKRDYKKLVSFLLSTRMHMILCSRAKQPILEAIVEGEKTLQTQPGSRSRISASNTR